MASDFSRTLALLRREKKISQRTAADDLSVSQALLSHYENGLREPGLSFVVRAADYYGVSCDYLLGRSLARDGSAVPNERLDVQPDPAQQKNLVLDAAGLVLELAEQTGSKQLPKEIEEYFSFAIYKAYRYMYLSDPAGVQAVFRTKSEHYDALSDARMKLSELRIRAAAEGAGGFGLAAEELARPSISPDELLRRYPSVSKSLLTVLQQVSDALEGLSGQKPKTLQKI